MSLKVPMVAAKTLGPTQVIEFIGIVLDSVQMVARLPEDKLARIKIPLKVAALLVSLSFNPLLAPYNLHAK